MKAYKKIHKNRDIHGSIMAISKDGHTMFENDVVNDLRFAAHFEKKIEYLESKLKEVKDLLHKRVDPAKILKVIDET